MSLGFPWSFNPPVIFLSDKWSPALQIRTVLLSIQALLSAPNPDDPLANDVAEKWKSSEAEAIETGECYDLAGFKRRALVWSALVPLHRLRKRNIQPEHTCTYEKIEMEHHSDWWILIITKQTILNKIMITSPVTGL